MEESEEEKSPNVGREHVKTGRIAKGYFRVLDEKEKDGGKSEIGIFYPDNK